MNGPINVQQYIRDFLAKAEAKYPDLITPDEFAELLAILYGSSCLILSEDSFNQWVFERPQVEQFLVRRIRLNRHDVHVEGSRLGHFKVMIYENEAGVFEFVELEWIPRMGSAWVQKIFELGRNAEVPPLGEVVTTLLSFET
jgi:hypothetical protein